MDTAIQFAYVASAALFIATTAADEPARLLGAPLLPSPMPMCRLVELSSSPPPPSASCARRRPLGSRVCSVKRQILP